MISTQNTETRRYIELNMHTYNLTPRNIKSRTYLTLSSPARNLTDADNGR